VLRRTSDIPTVPRSAQKLGGNALPFNLIKSDNDYFPTQNFARGSMRGQIAATCSMAITASISEPPCPQSRSGSAIPIILIGHEPRHVVGEPRVVSALERAGGEMGLCKAPAPGQQIVFAGLLGRNSSLFPGTLPIWVVF
jgi:hypothetical protein